MQPGNPLVGGLALRRAAIQSPNFVTGSTGWSINQDGSAEFNNTLIRGSETIGSGSRIVIVDASQVPAALQAFYTGNGGLGAAILFYNTGSAAYEYIGTVANTGATVFGAVSAAGQVAEVFRINPPTGAVASWQGGVTNALTLSFGAGTAIALAAGTQNGQATSFVTDVGLQHSDPINGGPEPWHAMTLLAGWTNFGAPFASAAYRLVSAPADSVHIVGVIAPGTKTDGTVIATLPAPYRPANKTVRFTVGQDGAVATNQRMDLAPSGNLSVNGVNLAGLAAVEFNEIIPLTSP